MRKKNNVLQHPHSHESQTPQLVSSEVNIASHIFMVSAALVGVCLTIISLIHIGFSNVPNISQNTRADTLIDDFLTLDAMGFLLACVLSYLAMRRNRHKPHAFYETVADYLFLSSLCLMTVICGLITYTLI